MMHKVTDLQTWECLMKQIVSETCYYEGTGDENFLGYATESRDS